MRDRFDLEEQLLACWQVVDDIQILQKSYDKMDDDSRTNLLQGLVELYKLKFEQVWSTYENMDWSKYAQRKD